MIILVLCGCESCSLVPGEEHRLSMIEHEEHKSRMFENETLSGIVGSKRGKVTGV
jgi:hypothetical protein